MLYSISVSRLPQAIHRCDFSPWRSEEDRMSKGNGGMSADDKAKWRGMTTDEKVKWMQINVPSPKRNGGMTKDERAKWRRMSADEKAFRKQLNALSLQATTLRPELVSHVSANFRWDLLKKKLYTEDGIPPARHPVQVKKAPSQEGSQPSQEAAPTRSLLAEVFVDAEVSTDTHVFERLGVKGCGEEVMAFVKNDSKTVVNIEDGAPDTSSGLVDDSKGSQPSKGAWHKARLLSLSLPEATVEAIGMVIVISVDSLRAVSKAKEQKPVILHPSLQLGGVKLNPYDYDFCEEQFIRAYDFCEEQFL